jgi:hypothetical protein
MVTSITGTKISLENLVTPLKSPEFAQTLKVAADLITGFVDASKKGTGTTGNPGTMTGTPSSNSTAPSKNPYVDYVGGTGGVYQTVAKAVIHLPGSPYMDVSGSSGIKINSTGPTAVVAPTMLLSTLSVEQINAFLQNKKGVGLGFIGDLLSPKAKGGPVSAMSTYLVGEKGPELFTPKGNGTIIPNTALQSYTTSGSSSSGSSGANGNNFNINVYNPTPEAASDSIGRTMRNLSYTGLFG